MSAYCQLARTRGWTLIEMLFALALLAVMTGVVFPHFSAWRERTQLMAVAEKVENALLGLPASAYLAASPRVVDSENDLVPELPQGWSLDVSSPLVYEPNGMTRGGEVKLLSDRKTVLSWKILPPAGRLVRSNE